MLCRFLLMSLLMFSSVSFAQCPDLRGSYLCASHFSSKPYFMKMDQSEKNGITTYTATTLSGSASIIADDILYVTPSGGDIDKYRTSCTMKPNMLTRLHFHIFNGGDVPGKAKTVSDFYIDSHGNLLKQTQFNEKGDASYAVINEACIRQETTSLP